VDKKWTELVKARATRRQHPRGASLVVRTSVRVDRDRMGGYSRERRTKSAHRVRRLQGQATLFHRGAGRLGSTRTRAPQQRGGVDRGFEIDAFITAIAAVRLRSGQYQFVDLTAEPCRTVNCPTAIRAPLDW